jgi:hypothetical protein
MSTRGGSLIRIYEVFESDYINGAWYDDERDVWYPCQWGWDGRYAEKASGLDLINKSKPTGPYRAA